MKKINIKKIFSTHSLWAISVLFFQGWDWTYGLSLLPMITWSCWTPLHPVLIWNIYHTIFQSWSHHLPRNIRIFIFLPAVAALTRVSAESSRAILKPAPHCALRCWTNRLFLILKISVCYVFCTLRTQKKKPAYSSRNCLVRWLKPITRNTQIS